MRIGDLGVQVIRCSVRVEQQEIGFSPISFQFGAAVGVPSRCYPEEVLPSFQNQTDEGEGNTSAGGWGRLAAKRSATRTRLTSRGQRGLAAAGTAWLAEWLWANPALRREWARDRRAAPWPVEAARWLGLALLLAAYAAAAFWLSRAERSPWEARTFLLGICLLYLGWVSVAVPGPAATRIVAEKERRTWEALLLTALRPSQVVTAKLVASLRSPALALAQFLPLLAMGTHAARLSPGRLVFILFLLLATNLTLAVTALWLSGRCRRSRTALALAYLLTGICFWGALVCEPARYVHGENLWWYVSPVWQVAVLCLAEPGPGPLLHPLLPQWSWFLCGCAGLSTALLVSLVRRIAGPAG
jgi:hypothetical protein